MTLRRSKSDSIEGCFVGRDGRQIEVEGSLTCYRRRGEEAVIWGICRDITERKQAQVQLYHLAHHDLLTGLPNRLSFIDRLHQARAQARRLEQKLAVFFLDLDRFKVVNDTLGHTVGDEMLQETARRLVAGVRESDTVARLGGDEFTVILGNLTGIEAAEKIAGKLLKSLAQPLFIGGRELFTTASIGISIFPRDGEDPLTLIKNADIAMYQAKARGRNNYQFYAPAMDLHADRRLAMEIGLRRALEREEFILHYQPKVDVASGRVTAMEALLRWQHPELGLLPPAEFIPLAEETGLILALGEWVLRTACAQNRAWQEAGLPPVPVAVNLSGHQLQQKDMVRAVDRILKETGLHPGHLELEITETVIMQNPDFAAVVLGKLKSLGVRLAIDDFGTGYSSLSHLKRFAVNTLKIDKIFVRDVETSAADAAIATALIAMGNNLSLQIVAEGVETDGQLSFLREQRCHEVQGYLFSRPLPAAVAVEFLRASQAISITSGISSSGHL
jgi:diguanylate cyclase (GGDEF)-like protein